MFIWVPYPRVFQFVQRAARGLPRCTSPACKLVRLSFALVTTGNRIAERTRAQNQIMFKRLVHKAMEKRGRGAAMATSMGYVLCGRYCYLSEP